MPDTLVAVLLTGASNVLILAVTLYFQSRRDVLHYEQAQRNARLERVRAAYRLLLQSDNAVVDAAWSCVNLDIDEVKQRIAALIDSSSEQRKRARVELTLENMDILELDPELDAGPDVLYQYTQFRRKLSQLHAKHSPVGFEE